MAIPKTSVSKNIYVYDICLNNQNMSIYNIFNSYYTKFNNDYNNLEARNLIYKDKVTGKIYFLDIKSINQDKISGILYLLRDNSFPYLFDLITGNKQAIHANTSEVLMEQTHFIIYPNENIMLSEYNHNGARTPILRYFLPKIVNNSIDIEFIHKLNRDAYAEAFKFKSLSKIAFKVGAKDLEFVSDKINIPISLDFEQWNKELDIEISVTPKNPKQSFKTDLKDMILDGIKNTFPVLKTTNSGIDIKKLSLGGKHVELQESILINLLQNKIVQKVVVPKLDINSKYINTESMFEKIEMLYNEFMESPLAFIACDLEEIEDTY